MINIWVKDKPTPACKATTKHKKRCRRRGYWDGWCKQHHPATQEVE
ncbi:DUF5763 domain-containing protein [Zhongshania sp.]